MSSDGYVLCAVLGAWGRKRRTTASGSVADAAACTPLPLCGFVRSILPPLTMVETVFTRSASERLHARGAKVQKVVGLGRSWQGERLVKRVEAQRTGRCAKCQGHYVLARG